MAVHVRRTPPRDTPLTGELHDSQVENWQVRQLAIRDSKVNPGFRGNRFGSDGVDGCTGEYTSTHHVREVVGSGRTQAVGQHPRVR